MGLMDGPSSQKASQNEQVHASTEAPGVYHRRKGDPVGWLRFQKRRWRETAAARKKRRIEAAQQRDRGPLGPQPAPRGEPAFSPAQSTRQRASLLSVNVTAPVTFITAPLSQHVTWKRHRSRGIVGRWGRS
jgi:hypothetical protein